MAPGRGRTEGNDRDLVVAGLAFGVSGIAALVYQVAWQRLLVLHTGIGVYSVAVVVAAFIGGLGLGSLAGGRLSARTSARQALVIFAGIELSLSLFASISCVLYYDVLFVRFNWLYASEWRALVLHAASLAVPTTLMGMSLPFLVRSTVRSPETASQTIGYLYALNVVGASLGALLTPWVFVRLAGLQGAVWIGAAANAVAGLAALSLYASRSSSSATEPPSRHGQDAPTGVNTVSSGTWLLLSGLSGFIALSLELVWFRIVEVTVKSNAFTFGTVLSLYLLGLALGALGGARLADRITRPLRVFLTCQVLSATYAIGAIVLLVRLPADLPLYGWYVRYWGSADSVISATYASPWELVGSLTLLYLVLPLALFGLPTVLSGFAFVVLQRGVQDDVRTSGRRVGTLQAANIAGGVAGTLLVGLASLTWLGTPGTVRLLAVVSAVFVAVGIRVHGARGRFGAGAIALGALMLALPGNQSFWARLRGVDASTALVEEDASGVVAATPGAEQTWSVSLNGRGISWLPFGNVHSVLGAAPALIHPAPDDVAVIGLGSGDTAWAAGCRANTRSVTVFEVSAPQPRLLTRLSALGGLPDLQRFLEDGRVTVRLMDGRTALQREERRYDLIEADPLPVHGAYSGHLYSLEFFRACARRLKPGGLMCAWSPTPRVSATFARVFPHIVQLRLGNSTVLVGSNAPLETDTPTWLGRLNVPEVSAYLGPDVVRLTRAWLESASPLPASDAGRRDLNRDLFPRDEFASPPSD